MEDKKNLKRFSKKTKIISLAIVGTFLSAILVFGFYILISNLMPAEEIVDKEATYTTYLKKIESDSKTPLDYSSYDNIGMALWKIENTNEYKTKTEGTAVAAGLTQLVLDSKTVKNDTIMLETISSGVVKMAKQRYLTPNQILMRDGKLNGTTPVWNNNDAPVCITKEAYLKKYGWWPNQATGYIVCKETMLEEPVVNKNSDGTYDVKMILNPETDYAPYWYRREVMDNSGSKVIPRFHKVEITINFDSKWTINYMDVCEAYTVKAMGIEARTDTNCHVDFYYDNIEFERDTLSYFDSYKDLVASDDNDDSDEEDDNLTILVSSLQNSDGSNKVLSTTIKVNDNTINGNIALNISDVQNIKVIADLNNLYVEYNDDLYLKIGNYKIKCNINDIKELIMPLIPNSNSSMELDTSDIMASFNKGKRTVNGNIIDIEVNLDIMGIAIKLDMRFTNPSEHEYLLNKAVVTTRVMDNDISISLYSTATKLNPCNKDDFEDLNNIDYIVKMASSILTNKKMSLVFNTEYSSIIINGSILADFNNDIKVKALLSLNCNNKDINVALYYINDVIYISTGNINVSLSKSKLLEIINEFALPMDSSMDLNIVINLLFKLDYNKLLKELKLDKNSTLIKLGLNELVSELNDITIAIKDDTGLNIDLFINDIKANVKLTTTNEEVVLANNNYNSLDDVDYIIKEVKDILDRKYLSTNISFNYNDLEVEGVLNLSFSDSVNVKLNGTIKYNAITTGFTITYFNEAGMLYLSIANVNLSLNVNSYFNKDSSIPVNDILDQLFSLDLDKLISNLEISNSVLSLELSIAGRTINVDIYNDSGLKLKVTGFGELMVALNDTFNLVTLDEKSYVSLENIINNLDDIIEVIKTKKFAINIASNITIEEANVKLNGTVNIDMTESIKVSALLTVTYNDISIKLNLMYADGYIYIFYNDTIVKLSFEELIGIINNYTKGNTVDYSLINEIINSFSITNDNCSVDLSNVLNIGKVTVTSSSNKMNLTASSFNLSMDFNKSNSTIDIPADGYITITDLDKLLDDIANLVDIIKTKNISLDLVINTESITASGNALIDFRSDIKAYLVIDLTYKNTLYKVKAYYINNILYADINGVLVSLSLEDLLPTTLSLGKLDINELIDLAISNNSLNVKVNLAKLGVNLEKLFTDNTIDLSLTGNTVEINDIINISINKNTLDITLDDNEYMSLDTIVSNGLSLFDVINSDAFSVSVSSEVYISKLDMMLTIDGVIKASLKDKLIDGNMSITTSGFVVSIDIKLVDGVIYIGLGNTNLCISLENINQFVEAIKKELNIPDTNIDINNILKSLVIEEDTIKVNLSSIIEILSSVAIKISNSSVDITANDISISTSIGMIDSFTVEAPKNNILAEDDIISIVKIINKIINITKNDSYYLDLDLAFDLGPTSSLWEAKGYFYYEKATEDEPFKLKLVVDLYEYKDKLTVNAIHSINVTIINNMIYATYGNNPNDKLSLVKIYTPLSDITSFGKKLIETLKTMNLSLYDIDDSLIDIMSFLNNIEVNGEDLIISILDSNNNLVSVSVNSSDILEINSNDIYINYDSINSYKKLRFNSVKLLDKKLDLEVPNLDGYYDIKDLDKLAEGILTLSKYKSFKVEGVVSLKAVITIDVPVTLIVSVVDGKVSIGAHIDMKDVPNFNMAGVTVSKKQLYYYYSDGYVYILRKEGSNGDGTKYELKVTLNEFFNNIAYYLLDFGMNLGPTIMNQINKSGEEDVSVDAGKCVNSYSYNNNKFSFSFNMTALTGNSDLGDLEASLNVSSFTNSEGEESYYLNSISSFKFSMLSFIELKLSKPLSLTNFSVVDGSLVYTEVSFDDSRSYIDSYSYPTDYVYVDGKFNGKCSHTITYVYGMGLDDEAVTLQNGSSIQYKDHDVVLYEDRYYRFVGWYLDKTLKNPAADSIMGNNSYALYAKWELVEFYKLNIISFDGNKSFDAYGSEDITKYLDYSFYNQDNVMYHCVGIYTDSSYKYLFTNQAMPNSDLTLYVKWVKVKVDLYINDVIYLENINESTDISLDGFYYININGVIYGYNGISLTAQLMFNYDFIDYSEEAGSIKLYTNVSSDLYTIALEYNYMLFNDNPFVSVSLDKNTNMDASYLPSSVYGVYSINYWYNDNDYHNGNINTISHTNQILRAYYSTESLLSFGTEFVDDEFVLAVNGFIYDGNDLVDVIIPKYHLYNGKYEIVRTLANFTNDEERISCFTYNQKIQAIYFNEGFTTIGNNAFKNCSNLKYIYFSSTVEYVKDNNGNVDAFYFTDSTDPNSLRFYFVNGSALNTINKTNWLANKNFFGTRKYYGKDYKNSFNTINSLVEEVYNKLK